MSQHKAYFKHLLPAHPLLTLGLLASFFIIGWQSGRSAVFRQKIKKVAGLSLTNLTRAALKKAVPN